MRLEKLNIINFANGMAGVYSNVRRGQYDTPLIFKGTRDQCENFIINRK